MSRHTAEIPITDITLPPTSADPAALPDFSPLDRTDTVALPVLLKKDPWPPEIPEPITPDIEREQTRLLNLPPTYDYSFHEQVERDLQVKLVDLEAWAGLREKYGNINMLISTVNSDLIVLNRTDDLFDELEDL